MSLYRYALILSSIPRKFFQIKTWTLTYKAWSNVEKIKSSIISFHKEICICRFTFSFQTILTFSSIITSFLKEQCHEDFAIIF